MASSSSVSIDSGDFNGCDEGSSESGGGSPVDSGSDSAFIQSEIEKRLEVGSVFESLDLDRIYLLYSEYARCLGFSVRKGWQRCFPDSIDVRTKVYHCSCEGHPKGKLNVGSLSHFNKHMIRSDCKAMLRVDRELDGPWTVSVFDKDHNHELLPQEPRYQLHRAPNLIYTEMDLREALDSADKVTEKASGGTSRVRKETKLDITDLVWVFEFLSEKSNKEQFFYWDFQFDDDGRLMNFFFRDYRCLVDYEFFGDVLCIDTTYLVKGSGLACVPFTGVNNHRKSVMFGLAFLSDETTETFEWLLKTFMKSMFKKEPQVILSDKCGELMDVVGCTFQTSSHRLCQWHVNRDAESQADWNDEFKKMWHRCMNGCETEAEFESSWLVMIEALGHSDRPSYNDTWFGHMYRLRQKWASVFTDGRFSAGLRAILRSADLDNICLSSDSLRVFMLRYHYLQDIWRGEESIDDAATAPEQLVENNKLLGDAARVYTREVYEVFEHEALYTLNFDIVGLPECDMSGDDVEFDVSSDGRTWRVRFNRLTDRATCACRRWETEGVLCRHVLKIYYTIGVERLPEECAVKRWRRDARVSDMEGYSKGMEGGDRIKYMTRVFYDMLLMAEGNPKAMSFLGQQIKCIWEEVKLMKQSAFVPSSNFGKCRYGGGVEGKGKRKMDLIN